VEWLDACFSPDHTAVLSPEDIASIKVYRINFGRIYRIDKDGVFLRHAEGAARAPNTRDTDCFDYWFIPKGMVRKVVRLVPEVVE
jgi:hypothetical protein